MLIFLNRAPVAQLARASGYDATWSSSARLSGPGQFSLLLCPRPSLYWDLPAFRNATPKARFGNLVVFDQYRNRISGIARSAHVQFRLIRRYARSGRIILSRNQQTGERDSEDACTNGSHKPPQIEENSDGLGFVISRIVKISSGKYKP
jgi:hypothetical protein